MEALMVVGIMLVMIMSSGGYMCYHDKVAVVVVVKMMVKVVVVAMVGVTIVMVNGYGEVLVVVLTMTRWL
ncbi:unnamed protein product [Prunus armeniaca]